MPIASAQQAKTVDSILLTKKSYRLIDSFFSKTDTLKKDSVAMGKNNADEFPISKDAPDSSIHYTAKDSLIFDTKINTVRLLGDATIDYKDLNLKAYQIDVDWTNHLMKANGKMDSVKHKTIGNPVFKESDKTYESKRMVYNYETQKGKIYDLVTAESEGFIHSDVIKKSAEKEYLGYQSLFTTCNDEHPHFGFRAKRIKVIPNKLIITGPAQLIIENIPTPLFVPFAIFPIKKGQASGLLIPQFANDYTKGLGLQNGGYYLGLGAHHDLSLTGDLYSHGSYAIRALSGYNYKYKYSGSLFLAYASTRIGDPQEPSFRVSKDFHITWRHQKDPRSDPYNLFSASVDAGTSRYTRNNEYDASAFLTNTYSSSISYQRIFPNLPINLTINANHIQNNNTHDLNINAPNIAFSVNRINPFARKNNLSNDKKWYENIGLSYNLNATNQIQTKDTLLGQLKFKDFKNGISHVIPVSTNFKVLKYFTLAPSVTYTERWFTYTSAQDFTDSILTHNKVQGFKAERDFLTSVALTTKIFGMKQFKHGKIKAIRHVITPSISGQWHPDYGSSFWGYYKTSPADNKTPYSIFEQSIIGGPPSPGKYGGIGISVTNDLEMKVYDRKDTLNNHTRKITILRSLAFSTFYNFAADSLNLSPINISTTTSLFKQKINANFSMTVDPYEKNLLGKDINRFAYQDGKLGRITRANVSIGSNFATSQTLVNFAKQQKGTTIPNAATSGNNQSNANLQNPNTALINFNKWHIPLTFNANYMLSITPTTINFHDTIIYTQSVNWQIAFGLTPKWNITFNSGYDFRTKALSTYNDIVILRDLHCWQMRIQIAPGRFYAIQINAKANILNDMELKKRKTYSSYYF